MKFSIEPTSVCDRSNVFSFWACFVIVLLLFFVSSSISLAANAIETITVTADNYLRKDNRSNNKGDSNLLKTDETNKSHIPVRFDQQAIASAIDGRPLISASLKMYIVQNWGGFTTSGKEVDVYRITGELGDWTEMGSSWGCPFTDCTTHWEGGTYVSTETDHLQWYDTTVGTQSFDVTSDVNSFMNGTTNYGWLLSKFHNFETGSVDIASKEYSDSSKMPKLVLTIDVPPVVQEPAIYPTPNQYFWNNTSVTVTFTCTDDDACSCAGPYSLSDEGKDQHVSGTCTDSHGASSGRTADVSIDKSDPIVVITSPPDDAELVGPVVTVTGTVADQEGLSGVRDLICNSEEVEVVESTFTFEASLSMGPNSISCVATDFADNEGGDEIDVTRVSEKTYTFTATEDTYLNSYYPDANYGDEETLVIGETPDTNHVLVQFSQDDIRAAIGANHVLSAYLDLYEETNGNDWGWGANIDIYRMSHEWNETDGTWNCPDAACEEAWNGGYYENGFTDTLVFENGDPDWRNFNVTSDIQLTQNDYDTYGWLLRKRDYQAYGTLEFTSAQETSNQRPKLVVTVDDQSCMPVVIDTITPGLMPSDGTTTTITVSGQNLDLITQLYVDGAAVNFDLLDSSTLTFPQSYVASGDHQLALMSNCLTDPVFTRSIRADTDEYAASGPGCSALTAPTLFSVGTTHGQLCWNNSPTRLIGYSGFNFVSRDDKWNLQGETNCPSGDDGNNDSDEVPAYFAAAQYSTGASPSDGSKRGSNFVRINAMGDSCAGGFSTSPQHCYRYASANPETIPFYRNANGKYHVALTTAGGSQLSCTWKKRLKRFIQWADQNGIAVTIDLFDQVFMADQWARNPWNKTNNDSGCSLLSAGIPDFYKLKNSNGTKTCLWNFEKNYVKGVVTTVKNLKVCGASGAGICRNVMFEVMNEAQYKQDWTFSNFKTWHSQIAAWVHSVGGYLVSGDVKGAGGDKFCDGESYDDSCLLSNCSNTSCSDYCLNPPSCTSNAKNYFDVLTSGSIDIVSLHAFTWLEGDHAGEICGGTYGKDSLALNLGKPVIFDEDGDRSGLSDNDLPTNPRTHDVQEWTNDVAGCSHFKGQVNLNHFKDGWDLENDNYGPNDCNYPDGESVDCNAWWVLADGVPGKYCKSGDSNVTPCQTRILYCEHGTSGCNP
jgi:hypothetical protein